MIYELTIKDTTRPDLFTFEVEADTTKDAIQIFNENSATPTQTVLHAREKISLSEYIKLLTAIKDKYGDLPIIYSSDDEGNSFQLVNFYPSVGKFTDNEFDPKSSPNAVCIN